MEQIQPGSSVKVITSRGVLTAPQVVITAGEPACVYALMQTCVQSKLQGSLDWYNGLCRSLVS